MPNGAGEGRRRQYVRDGAEKSLDQPPAFGSRAGMEDPCPSQSHSRRMVPYGEKQGRGGSLALFTVLTRDGCCSSATEIARMAAPKKEKRTSHEVGRAVWIISRSAICALLRQKWNTRPRAVDENPSRRSHARQLGPPAVERGSESGRSGWVLLELRWLGRRQTHLGTAARHMFGTRPLKSQTSDPLVTRTPAPTC